MDGVHIFRYEKLCCRLNEETAERLAYCLLIQSYQCEISMMNVQT